MVFVVDTDVLIDHLRDVRAATELLARVGAGGDRVVASVLSKAELITGTRRDEWRRVMHLFDRIDWGPVSEGLAEDAGMLAAQFRKSHPGVDLTDYVIAATAIRLDADLLTRNTKHFPMFPGLEAPY